MRMPSVLTENRIVHVRSSSSLMSLSCSPDSSPIPHHMVIDVKERGVATSFFLSFSADPALLGVVPEVARRLSSTGCKRTDDTCRSGATRRGFSSDHLLIKLRQETAAPTLVEPSTHAPCTEPRPMTLPRP